MTTPKRDFLALDDLTADELLQLLQRAGELKRARAERQPVQPLPQRVLGMVFDKASTRTRVSFEVAMFELGGHAIYLSPTNTQMGRGESLADTGRVLSGYCHAIVMRTHAHERVEELARHASVPVINGLTDLRHPCQIGADLFTVQELFGDVAGVRHAWIGDGNNMANSWITVAGILGLDLALACPEGFEPDDAILERARARMATLGRGSVRVTRSPEDAVAGADVVSTDVWASMGQEAEAAERARAFAGYTVDRALLAHASERAVVLHCLPAHRGEEIAAEVIDAPDSAVWRQAENRLHLQKALLELVVD